MHYGALVDGGVVRSAAGLFVAVFVVGGLFCASFGEITGLRKYRNCFHFI